MPTHNSMVKFKYGPKEDFTSLTFKDPNTLYFCTDTKEIFLGELFVGNGTITDDSFSLTSLNPIQNKVVKAEFDKFFIEAGTGKNLFNPNDAGIVEGQMFSPSGELQNIIPGPTYENFMTSGYIEVEPGEKYIFSWYNNDQEKYQQLIRSYCMYNENKQIIPNQGEEITIYGIESGKSGVSSITIPLDREVKYIRVSGRSITNRPTSEWQFEKSSKRTSYEPYQASYRLNPAVEVDAGLEKFFTETPGKNLFNINDPKVAIGKWFQGEPDQEPSLVSSGYSVNYMTSGYMEVEPNKKYNFSVYYTQDEVYKRSSLIRTYAIYDENYNYVIWGENAPQGIIEIPSTGKYIRATTYAPSYLQSEKWQFELGEQSTDYVDYQPSYKLSDNIVQPNYINSYFNNKKAVFIGDSITAGYTKNGYVIAFPDFVAKNLNMTYKNYGIGGSEIAVGSTPRDPMCIRYTEMDDDADLVIVAGGTNDWAHSTISLGEMPDYSDETNPPIVENTNFYGALDILCRGLLNKYPGKEIVFMTPIKRDMSDGTDANARKYYEKRYIDGHGNVQTRTTTLKDYVKAIKEVCDFYGIPVIDMYANCPLNPINETIKQQFFAGDGSHPNVNGQEIMGRIVTGGILSLYNGISE